MNIKIFLYAIGLMSSIFAVSGININQYIKKGHVWEARFLAIIIIFCLSYLLTNFMYDIINLISL